MKKKCAKNVCTNIPCDNVLPYIIVIRAIRNNK